jgi:hypothetical protein
VDSLTNLIGTAHQENIGNDEPSTWHFPEAGSMLAPVLAVFCQARKKAVLDWHTNVSELVAQEPMIIDAYIEAVISDPGMWLGPLEVKVLQALRAAPGVQARPIQLCLPSQAPEIAASIDVSALIRKASASGKQSAGKSAATPTKLGATGARQSTVLSAGGKLLDIPRWVYPKLTPVCYLQDEDITGIFIEAGWETGQQSHHVFVCPTVPAPLELHASLTQKPPIQSPYVTQVEFVLMPKVAEGGQRDRTQGARFWYLIRRHAASGTVRLEFQGNVSASEKTGDEAQLQMVRQFQSDENERGYARFLAGLGVDPAAAITAMIEALQAGLSKLPPRNPSRK